MQYRAPLNDFQFLLFDVFGVQDLQQFESYTEVSPDVISMAMDGMGRFAAEVLQPLNRSGDREGCSYDAKTHEVKTPEGFREAYAQFAEAGWTSLDAPPEVGGQGMPHVLKFVVDEMVCSTNLSLGMYAALTHGAISALHAHGAQALRDTYLPKMVSGEWSGTMCLTEPQCGTDLGLIRTRAVPEEDGSYKLEGTKIWITGGEHDLVDNIVHLVLAKLPGAPDSTKGISLFVVPKFLPDSGERNAVSCGGIEHKMGIKASSTCVMNFEGAKGWLVGEPNDGMRAMFTMMNEARLLVGIQGLGLSEMAYQESLGFARERLQGRAPGGASAPDQPADPIIVHPDVRRMLMRQKVLNEGMRALALFTGHQFDLSVALPDAGKREAANDLVQLLTPVVKGFLTDEGFNNSNLGLQVLGGAGYTTDWPLEQLVRDGRIARIYEGTNGIQAMDLVGRKLGLAGGRLAERLFAVLEGHLESDPEAPFAAPLRDAVQGLREATRWLAENGGQDPEQAAAGAWPYLRLAALTVIGYLWSRMAAVAQAQLDAGTGNRPFLEAKLASAQFYFEKVLPEVLWLQRDVCSGKASMMALADEHWDA
jgi:alkylation response protein AidB-like acyl-CoA dehydrogenase